MVAVLSFHVVMLVLTVVTRRSEVAQSAIFITCASAVLLAERLNALAQTHWREFSSQDYFDKDGVFTTTVFCMPLVCVLVLVLINFLRLMTGVMIQAKRAQLKQRARTEKKKER